MKKPEWSVWHGPVLKDKEGFYILVHNESAKELELKDGDYLFIKIGKIGYCNCENHNE